MDSVKNFTFPDTNLIKKTNNKTGERYYYDSQGLEYPSVTTVLSYYEDKTTLMGWRNRVGKEQANKEVKEAIERGNAAHKYIEKYFDQTKVSGDESNRVALQAINHFYSKVSPVCCEKQIYYNDEAVRYAGTFDHLVHIDENIFCIKDTGTILEPGYYLCDLKTKKTIASATYPSFVLKTVIQGSAYIKAIEALADISIKGFVIVAATSKSAKAWVSDKSSLDFYWTYWYELLQDFYKREPLTRDWNKCILDLVNSYDFELGQFCSYLPLELVCP